MPLDAHSHLVGQGWTGKGTGLRKGAISRPLAIPQKRTLAGVGKDRDEAFPFWDHLFSAAAKSIQVTCLSDDEDGEGTSTSENVTLKRTSTGILSTGRPIDGTPAHSGSTTPADMESDTQTPRLSLMAQAKRDAARKGLYSRFFKGPILGPETIAEEEKRLEALIAKALEDQDLKAQSVKVTEHIEVQLKNAKVAGDLEVSTKSKKRKSRDGEESAQKDEDDAARKERKRRKKEEKEAKAKLKEEREKKEAEEKRKEKKERKEKEKKDKKGKSKSVDVTTSTTTPGPSVSKESMGSKDHDDSPAESEDERRRRKKEKKEKKRLKALGEQQGSVPGPEHADDQEEEPLKPKAAVEQTKDKESRKVHKERSTKSKDGTNTVEPEREEKKKKKKRKREEDSDD